MQASSKMAIHGSTVLFKLSTNANNKEKNSKQIINCRKNIKTRVFMQYMDISKLTLHSELRLYPKVCAFREPAFM